MASKLTTQVGAIDPNRPFSNLFLSMQGREKTKIDIDDFSRRHIGPNENETADMLRAVGFENLDALIEARWSDERRRSDDALSRGRSGSKNIFRRGHLSSGNDRSHPHPRETAWH